MRKVGVGYFGLVLIVATNEKIQVNSIYYEADLEKINGFSWKLGKSSYTKVSLNLELGKGHWFLRMS